MPFFIMFEYDASLMCEYLMHTWLCWLPIHAYPC